MVLNSLSFNLNVGAFNIVPEVSEIVFNSFLSFLLVCKAFDFSVKFE